MKRLKYLEEGGSLTALTTEHNRITMPVDAVVKTVSLRITDNTNGTCHASAAIAEPISGSTSVLLKAVRSGKPLGGQFDYASWEFNIPVYRGYMIQVSMWAPNAGNWRIMVEYEVDE